MATPKDIPHPIWEELVENWLSHVPPDLDPPGVSVEQLFQRAGRALIDKQEVETVLGVREATFSEALFLREKALNFFCASRYMVYGGYSTLPALSMYDACFFAARSLLYLSGFRDVGINMRWYTSIFFSIVSRRKPLFDGHLAFQLSDRMTHEMLWKLFSRLVNTIKGSAYGANLLVDLRKNDYDSFSKPRNQLVYNPISWSRSSDYDESDLNSSVSYIDNAKYFLSSGKDRAEYVDKYYRTAHSVINIIDEMLGEIGKIAPAVSTYLLERPGLTTVASSKFS